MLRRLQALAQGVSGVLFLLLFLVFLVQIVARMVFNSPLPWSDEAAVVLYLWVILWATALVVPQGEQVMFDLAWNLAGPRLPYEAAAALATALPAAAFFGQILHRALAEELGRPYVRTALAKGLSRNAVVWRHAFPNAALVLLDGAVPKVTLLLTGSFIAERIFNVQGFGFLYVHAALERQAALVVVGTTVFAALLVLVALAAELLRAAVDPEFRRGIAP